VTPWYLPHLGGLERHVEALSSGIKAFDSVILTPRMPGTAAVESPAPNVRIHRFGPTKFPDATPSGAFGRYREWVPRFERLWNLRGLLRDTRFDVLHVHRPPIMELAYLAAKWGTVGALRPLARRFNRLRVRNVPRVFTDHGFFVHPYPISGLNMAWFMEWALTEFQHVICVERAGFSRATEMQRRDPSAFSAQVQYIPQPIDTDLFRPAPPPDSGDLIVGYTGRWERDGMSLLAQMAEVRTPGVQFLVSGGATEKDLARYGPGFQRAGVRILPNIQDMNRLSEFYRGIHVIVDFYRGDGTGRSVLEAMASGRPAIRIRSRDTHPVVDGETGILVDSDVESISSVLRELVGRREEVAEMGRRARSIVEQEYGFGTVLSKVEQVYRTCLSTP